jgi:hypothetical protein
MKAGFFQITRRTALASTGGLLAACGGSQARGQAGQSRQTGQSDGLLVQVMPANTDIAVGRNRLAVAILQVGQGGQLPKPLVGADVKFRFFYPIEPQPVVKGEAAPTFRHVGDQTKGLYVATVQLDQPGPWGLEVSGRAGTQDLAVSRVRFDVQAQSQTPALGSPAPRSNNPTRRDVDDIKKIASEATPCNMHDLSIAQAIDLKKPVVISFTTPGFCATQYCAPQLQATQALQAKMGDRASFVHVEIFKDPNTRTVWETVNEWKLGTEPWTFLVDRGGLVAEKFEGPAPADELEAALTKLL